MRNPLTCYVFISLIIFCLLASCAAPDDPNLPHYDIRLFRPVAVGDHFTIQLTSQLTSTDEVLMSSIIPDKVIPGQKVSISSNVSMTVEATVQATSANGRQLKTRYIVTASNQSNGTKTSEILPIETEIIADYTGNGKIRFTVAGAEASTSSEKKPLYSLF